MIDPELKKISISTQCRLLSVPRSSYYHKPNHQESSDNLAVMSEMDKIYLAHPAFGSRKITQMLARRGIRVNRKRVRRLMKVMGIRSLAPQQSTTKSTPAHLKYPYLLRDMVIDHPNCRTTHPMPMNPR